MDTIGKDCNESPSNCANLSGLFLRFNLNSITYYSTLIRLASLPANSDARFSPSKASSPRT